MTNAKWQQSKMKEKGGKKGRGKALVVAVV